MKEHEGQRRRGSAFPFPSNLLFIPLFPFRSNFLNELERGNAF